MNLGRGEDEVDVMELSFGQLFDCIPEVERLSVDIGRWRRLPPVGGTMVGDDVSWRGAKVVRCVALQTNG